MVFLLASQNPDGGWPYTPGGPSWTEPTAYALLALNQPRPAAAPFARGLQWLRAAQLPDGGWSPHPAVRQSTWVTALAVLLGPELLGKSSHRRGLAWVLKQTGEDSNLFSRFRELLMGHSPEQMSPAWPWFPHTSAWVTPTALSILALRKVSRFEDSETLRVRLEMGAAYLLAHACSDGGWNHGAARALDYDARSYPETTGVALLALAGNKSSKIGKACRWAQEQLPKCQSSEAESWLRLGLLAHGQLSPDAPAPTRTPRTVSNLALALLASAAGQARIPFLE